MSLKVPCKYCGKEISLRKMPNGQFVPFDKWTNTKHYCQDQSAKTAGMSDGSAKPQPPIDAGASVGDLVFRVVSESPGLKAKNIASTISRKCGVNVGRSEVNRWLYYDLKGKVYQNGSYQWFPGSAPSRAGTGSVGSGAYGGPSQPQGAPPGEVTAPTSSTGSGAKSGTNKLLWAIIVLLAILVLMLMKK